MIFKQYLLEPLSQLSYLIGDTTSGRAVVVDPHRDIAAYQRDAADCGLRIERVIETHCHADFVSGHLELAATGAAICYGAGTETDYPIQLLHDGQRIDLGDVVLEIRATPGHTPESICIVVYEHRDCAAPFGVLTGDTLLIGDVGRPDLSSAMGGSSTEMARQLYGSLHDKLLTLPGRDPSFSSPRRGFRVRAQPFRRALVHDRRTTADQPRAGAARRGAIRQRGHDRSAADTAVLLLRRTAEPPATSPAP